MNVPVLLWEYLVSSKIYLSSYCGGPVDFLHKVNKWCRNAVKHILPKIESLS